MKNITLEYGKEGTRAFGMVREVGPWRHPTHQEAVATPEVEADEAIIQKRKPRFRSPHRTLINDPPGERNVGKEQRSHVPANRRYDNWHG